VSDHLDWTDPEAVRRLMTGMESHLADLHAAVKDMLRKKRKRQLGHLEHKRIYREARQGVMAAIRHAMPPAAAASER
jgi:hypothetical protein